MEGLQGVGAHIQESMRLGTPRDIYYYTRDSVHKQSIPTIVDNRFRQALFNLSQGSSTFIISVDQGISDILFAASLPAAGSAAGLQYAGLAVAQGWLYALINRISIRYAGSSQYFWTGGQVLVESLREMPNPTTRDNLMQLGGVAMVGGAVGSGLPGDFQGDNLSAYAYLKFPHNSPNGSLMKPNPFPSELISQPIVVTLELNPIQSVFSSAVALGSLAGAPTTLVDGYFQVKQVHANDRGELMVAPADKSRAYSFPTPAFYQNEIQIQCSGQAAYNTLLTGFRSGQVRSIICWLTDNADTAPVTSAPFARNYFNYYLPRDVELLYNGTVYYDAQGTASEFWNLVSSETPSQVSNVVVDLAAGPSLSKVAGTSKWLEIPFSQVYEQLSGAHMYVAGKMIQNAVVNLNFAVPDETKDYTLHVMYAYNCVMMVAGGTCDYVF